MYTGVLSSYVFRTIIVHFPEKTSSQVKFVKTEGALDKPQIAIRIDDFLRCKSRIGDVAFYAVPCGIRFKLGVFSVAQIIQEAVNLTSVVS
jgi:hypothetical protein